MHLVQKSILQNFGNEFHSLYCHEMFIQSLYYTMFTSSQALQVVRP